MLLSVGYWLSLLLCCRLVMSSLLNSYSQSVLLKLLRNRLVKWRQSTQTKHAHISMQVVFKSVKIYLPITWKLYKLEKWLLSLLSIRYECLELLVTSRLQSWQLWAILTDPDRWQRVVTDQLIDMSSHDLEWTLVIISVIKNVGCCTNSRTCY